MNGSRNDGYKLMIIGLSSPTTLLGYRFNDSLREKLPDKLRHDSGSNDQQCQEHKYHPHTESQKCKTLI